MVTGFVWPSGVSAPDQQDAERWESDPAKRVVVRFYGVYAQTTPERLDDLLANNYRDHGHQPPGQGVSGARADYDTFSGHFSDVAYLLHDMIREGDRVAVRWTAAMTHSGAGLFGMAATGRRVTLEGFSIYQIAGGRIAATWNLQDVTALRAQIEEERT